MKTIRSASDITGPLLIAVIVDLLYDSIFILLFSYHLITVAVSWLARGSSAVVHIAESLCYGSFNVTCSAAFGSVAHLMFRLSE